MVGTYQFDAQKTYLGAYSEDSIHYSQLMLTLSNDSTFFTNMRVPFLIDTCGKWSSDGIGLEQWNYLYFCSWDLSKYEPNKGNQFGSLAPDSTMEVIGPYRDGVEGSQYLWFKKVK